MPVEKKSPIGYTEFFADPSEFGKLGLAAITRRDMQAPYAPYSIYNNKYITGDWKDNEEGTKTHERIHQGQFAAKIPIQGTKEYNTKLYQALRPYMSKSDFNDRVSQNGMGMEPPAYSFSKIEEDKEDKPKQQEAFNNYVKFLLSQNGKETIHNILAPMPQELQKGYINSGPSVPPPGLPTSSPEKLSTMLWRALSGKKK